MPETPEEKALRAKMKEMREATERIMAEAVSPEKLRNNPYKGKPLDLSVNPFEKDRALGHRMLRSAGFAPEWVEMKRELLRERRAIQDMVDEYVRRAGDAGRRSRDVGGRPGADVGRGTTGTGRTHGTADAARTGMASWSDRNSPPVPEGADAEEASERGTPPVPEGADAEEASERDTPSVPEGAGAEEASEHDTPSASEVDVFGIAPEWDAIHRRFLEDLHERVTRLRRRIESYNLKTPLMDQQLMNVRPDEWVAEARRRLQRRQ